MGVIRFDPNTAQLYYCNGTQWVVSGVCEDGEVVCEVESGVCEGGEVVCEVESGVCEGGEGV